MSEPQMTAEQAIGLLGHGWRTLTRPEAETVADFIRALAARNAELESAARWRSCKTEPPPVNTEVFFRWNLEPIHGVGYLSLSGVYITEDRLGHLGDPDEWRPIT